MSAGAEYAGDVCVRRVANGWMVTPAPTWQTNRENVTPDACWVFQTFTGLVEHLESIIGPKVERR